MVHFKPSPKNMYWNVTLNESTSDDSSNLASDNNNSNEQISSTLVGTDLELIKDYDNDDSHNTPPQFLYSESAT